MLRATRPLGLLLILIVIFLLFIAQPPGPSDTHVNYSTGANPTAEKFQKTQGQSKVHSAEAEEYFREISLGSEWSGTRATPWRQKQNLKIWVSGKDNPELQRELGRIVSELNRLIEPIEIEIVGDQQVANYVIFLGPWREFLEQWPQVEGERLQENWGYFAVQESFSLMYVDTDRANEVEQKHLLREELTQSLGLFNDSWKYTESIFYGGWTTTTEYTDLDRELIQMLYNEGR